MGGGGGPKHGIKRTDARNLNINGDPNSKIQRFKNGRIVQERWYDEKGRAIRNRDYEHQDSNHSHFFPHDHAWNWSTGKGIRDKYPVLPDYKNFN